MFGTKRDLFPHQPERPEGASCPWDKPSCKGCMLWVGQQVKNKEGVESMEYRCAPAWGALSGAALSARLDGIQKSTESLRNEFAKFHASTLALVGSLAGIQRRLNAEPSTGGALLEAPDA